MQLFQCFALALTGRVREMLQRFPALIQEAEEQSNLYASTTLQACLGFYVPITSDDPDTAFERVDEAIAQWSPLGYHLQHANALVSRVSVDLYCGEGQRGLDRCADDWPALERSLLLRGQLVRWLMHSTRARAALSAYASGGERGVLRLVQKTIRLLSRERVDYCMAEARMLRAGLAFHAGHLDHAVELLEEAEDLAEESELILNSVAIKRARGLLIGGDEGEMLVRSADTFLLEQGLSRPDRIAEIFAPGFTKRGA